MAFQRQEERSCEAPGREAARPSASAARNDEDAIKAVIASTTDAFSRHDAKAWVKFCTPDAQLVTVRGEYMNWVAEIERTDHHFPDPRSQWHAQDAAIGGAIIRPDVALAHVTNELSGLVNLEGQTLPSHQALSVRVLVKDQGVWRITAFSQHDSAEVIEQQRTPCGGACMSP